MTAYYNEFDPKAAAWLRELIRCGLIADGVVDERSILDVTPADLAGFTQCHFFAGIGGWSLALRLAGWSDDRPVWTGSPPCQPFSAAGRQLGQADERHLAPHFASLVAAGRPVALFGEQVASAAVFGKAPKRTGAAVEGAATPEWAWLDDLFERLEAAHYACGASDIPAAGVGAAHIRQRTFFGAQRLDYPAGPRHDGPLAGSEGLARNETWLRLSGARSGFVGLADDTSAGLETGRPEPGSERSKIERPERLRDDGGLEHGPGDGREQWRAEPSGRGASGGRSDGGVADAHGEQREQRLQSLSRGSAERAGRGFEPVGVGHADDAGSQEHGRSRDVHIRQSDGADQGRQHFDAGVSGGLADADRGQRGRVADGEGRLANGPQAGRNEGDGKPERGGATGGPDATDSPWRVADWLFCRDGKWRPVEPGTFPLANGLPARVGRLRGYGNAIVPQAACEFIKAFDAASDECFRLTEASRMTTDNEGVFG